MKTATRLYSAAPWANLTGAPISSLGHLVVLRDHFDEVGLILGGHGEIEARARAADVPVHCFPFEFRGLRRGGLRHFLQGIRAVAGSRWTYFSGLYRLLKEKPGLLHIHSRAVHLPYALLAGFFARVPVVVTLRESWKCSFEIRTEIWMIRWLANHVVFLSQEMARQNPRCLRGMSSVVHNHADIAEPRPAGPERARPRVTMPARMGHRKGVDVFLEVCRLLHEGGNDFEAWLVGEWETEEEHRQAMAFIREHGLESVIYDRGMVREMEPVYAQTDVLLLTSRHDPFPRVVMEAMCRGIPVVATHVDGVPEMVEDGVTGFLAPSEDAPGLANKVAALLSDAALRRQMGEAGRIRAQKLFSPEAYVQAMLCIYGELPDSGVPAPGKTTAIRSNPL